MNQRRKQGVPNGDGQRRAELAAIHVAKKALALDDESYRAILQRVGGKPSAAQLDAAGRGAVIEHFRSLGFTRPAMQRLGAAARRAAAGKSRRRPLEAKAVALWMSLYALGAVRDPAETAMDAFCRRTVKVDALRWCTPQQLVRVIQGLQDWCHREGFREPDEAGRALLDRYRGNAGLPPLEGAGHGARIALVNALWRRLTVSGAMRTGGEARLDTWLLSHGFPREDWMLSAVEADRAIDALGSWLRRHVQRGQE